MGSEVYSRENDQQTVLIRSDCVIEFGDKDESGCERLRFLGSKDNLIKEIDALLAQKVDGNEAVFLDLFAGTNAVGNFFKQRYRVITNDALRFSYVDAMAKLGGPDQISFLSLKKIDIRDPFEYLNNEADSLSVLGGESGYYEESYSPTGGAMYLTVKNAKRVDYIREQIERWFRENLINTYEYCYLLSTLIEAISKVSNTTGTYGAFLKHWDPRAKNALRLQPYDLVTNQLDNQCFNEDALDLVSWVEADIAYIDPPYNSRQYGANYHLVENVARHDKPALKGTTKIFDWSDLKSVFSMKRGAFEGLQRLLRQVKCTHLVLSYNDEGIVSIDELVALVEEFAVPGSVEVRKIPYRKYKSKLPSDRYDLHEVLIYARLDRLRNRVEVQAPKLTNQHVEPIQSLVKSPLNYVGGKFRLLPQILPLFPKNIHTFVDLFSGGANVGVNVPATRHIFNDMNSRINEFFRLLQQKSASEIVKLVDQRIEEWHLSKTNEESFLKFRQHYNSSPNPLDLYVLVAHSYNYQFRFNNRMEFNNPFGRNRSYFTQNMRDNLFKFSTRLGSLNAEFRDGFFEDFSFETLSDEDFVYLDPPYLISTGSYNDGNRGFRDWTRKQESQLIEIMEFLTLRGVRFALSNVLTHKGRTNDLLLKFSEKENLRVHHLKFDYDNSSHNSKARGSDEVLITNY